MGKLIKRLMCPHLKFNVRMIGLMFDNREHGMVTECVHCGKIYKF